MWLNFLPIYDKEQKIFDFAQIRDAQYHMALYECLAELKYKHIALLKKRQIASSYFHCGKLINGFWFEEGFIGKIGASLKDYINEKGIWPFLDEYANFLDTHTAWTRPRNPGKIFAWQQKVEITQNGKKQSIGLKSRLSGMSFEKDPTNGVGGPVSIFYHEEGGIAPKADITYGYIESALNSGQVTTGLFIIAGSVGELDQCGPLKDFILHPEANEILGVETNLLDDKGTIGLCGLFIPEQWSMLPFIDKYGNSLVKEALASIMSKRAQLKIDLSPERYQLHISQHPTNIAEAFASRKVSKFATHLIQAQLKRIEDKEIPYEILDLDRDNNGKIQAKESKKIPISEFPFNKKSLNKESALVVWERPIKDAPWGTYYASVDPVGEGKAEYVCNMVHTPKGQKKIGDVKPGDFVIGSLGFPVKVLQIYPQGVKSLYRVSFSDNTSILVCKEHLWQVELNGGTRGSIVLNTEQLMDKSGIVTLPGTGKNKLKNYKFSTYFKRPNGGFRWKIPLVKQIQYSKSKIILDAYALGLLLGDGSITGRGICFSSADQILIDELCQRTGLIARKVGKYDYRITTGKYGNHNPVTSILRKLRLMGTNSHTKFIPDQYKYASVNNRLALLQGLMDTDGYAGNHGAEYSTVSKQLAKDVASIVQSLGGVAPIRVKKGKNCISYNVRIKLPDSIIPFKLDRKIATYQIPSKYPAVRYITDISYEKDDEAVCLSVDSTDNLYVTEHAIVTHNTTTSDSLCSIIIYQIPTEVTKIKQDGSRETFIEGDKVVATWCGRYDDINDTHEFLELIIEWFNAWTIVEANVSLFILYMISKRKQKYLVPKDQIIFLKELSSNGSTHQDYGWKNTGTMFKTHLINYPINFVKEVIHEDFDDNGKVIKSIMGVTRIPDPMILKEMLAYQEGVNVDRLIAFTALIAFVKLQVANRGYRKIVEQSKQNLENSKEIYKLKERSPYRNIGKSPNSTNSKPQRSPFRNLR